MSCRRPVVAATFAATALATTPAAAHSGALRAAGQDPVAAPAWLFLLTGGAVVGASFLLASFVTDRALIDAVHGWSRPLSPPARPLALLGHAFGLAALAVGWVGPATGLRNLAVLLVWVAWWGGVVASAYLVGNPWPVLDPFRALSGCVRRLPGGTALGAAWFERVDPGSRLFAAYGRVAPVARGDDGVRLRLPGTALSAPAVEGRGEAAFVVAVWVAHAAAYDTFPDRLQAVRSQYGVTLAMVGFTVLSLWIVSEPYVAPPYLGT